jgi:WD40 domain-containing protein
VADPARPRLLRTLAAAPLQTHNPGNFDVGDGDLVFSPNGHVLASVSGSDAVTLWNVTNAARATRIATLTGPRDYFTALAFSPDGSLLAGVTYHGNVRVFRLTGSAGPVRVSTRRGLLARARFAGGQRTPDSACGPGCDVQAAYALEFTPDGHALMVVINRPEPYPSTSDRDTVFTWPVASSGALGHLTTFFRDVSDVQPTLAPGDRIVADGSMLNGGVHLWTLPSLQP